MNVVVSRVWVACVDSGVDVTLASFSMTIQRLQFEFKGVCGKLSAHLALAHCGESFGATCFQSPLRTSEEPNNSSPARDFSDPLICYSASICSARNRGIFRQKHSDGYYLLELCKGFDSVDHNILLTKLRAYGVSGQCLSWFKSYLSGRGPTCCG